MKPNLLFVPEGRMIVWLAIAITGYPGRSYIVVMKVEGDSTSSDPSHCRHVGGVFLRLLRKKSSIQGNLLCQCFMCQ